MARPAPSSNFDDLCWHDNALYGFRLDVGDYHVYILRSQAANVARALKDAAR